MIELSSVEWNHEHKCYYATFTNGEVAMLESTNLRAAEQEAEQVANVMTNDRFYDQGWK